VTEILRSLLLHLHVDLKWCRLSNRQELSQKAYEAKNELNTIVYSREAKSHGRYRKTERIQKKEREEVETS
jgi:hypothetical protein